MLACVWTYPQALSRASISLQYQSTIVHSYQSSSLTSFRVQQQAVPLAHAMKSSMPSSELCCHGCVMVGSTSTSTSSSSSNKTSEC
mmetsp:Transcript_28618/g.87573  ORF Transcript_28618/g.87573 Transcript_28618/m.87573 type:complete len:86 (+) Transcript_28618:356-613(+)